MAPRQCLHVQARFHSVQRLGRTPPIELWHCPTCQTTISVAPAHHQGRVTTAA